MVLVMLLLLTTMPTMEITSTHIASVGLVLQKSRQQLNEKIWTALSLWQNLSLLLRWDHNLIFLWLPLGDREHGRLACRFHA